MKAIEILHCSSCHCHVTSVSCDAPLPFLNPLLGPHGIVKCPLDAHFRISLEVVHHQGTYCFINNLNLNILLFQHTVFHLLYSREVCIFEFECILSLVHSDCSSTFTHKSLHDLIYL